jgi:hypothetical protein
MDALDLRAAPGAPAAVSIFVQAAWRATPINAGGVEDGDEREREHDRHRDKSERAGQVHLEECGFKRRRRGGEALEMLQAEHHGERSRQRRR